MSSRPPTGTGSRARAPASHRTGSRPPANRLVGPLASPPSTPPPSLPIFLPVAVPEQVHAARAHLTPVHAAGVDAVMWEARRHPMPDVSARAQLWDETDEVAGEGLPAVRPRGHPR